MFGVFFILCIYNTIHETTHKMYKNRHTNLIITNEHYKQLHNQIKQEIDNCIGWLYKSINEDMLVKLINDWAYMDEKYIDEK